MAAVTKLCHHRPCAACNGPVVLQAKGVTDSEDEKLSRRAGQLHPAPEEGWCSGEGARLPSMWPGFDSGLDAMQLRGMSLLFPVLYSAPRGFCPGRVLWLSNSPKIKIQFGLI